jgi:hypothetical protein
MSRHLLIPVAVFAVVLAGCSSKARVVRFEVGGPATDAHNSANAPWGASVSGLQAASSYVVAAGDEQVICRILLGNRVVSEARANGAGQRAVCTWGA